MRYFTSLSVSLGLAFSAFAVQAENAVTAPNASLKKLADDFAFTEGPTCDASGNVYFTDQPNNRIVKWSVDGKLTTFKQPCGRANGMMFDHQGHLISCSDETNQLWSISMDGKVEVLLKDYEGKLLNGPNDVWVRPDDGLYLTDPYYKRSWWKRGPKEMGEHVYFLSADRKQFIRVTDDLKQPNGITGTPDGKKLYVADIGAGKTYSYSIQPDGTLADKKLFCEMGSDGMTIDAEDNLYLTGKGVTIFNSSGKRIQHIPVDEGWTANVCFGGADRKTLFITASKGLYSIEMRVKGANAAK